jgi:hypothetical protein
MSADGYGRIAVPGHPLVRVSAIKHGDVVIVRYVGDREPLMATGVVPANQDLELRPRKKGKGSRPRSAESFAVDKYWRSEGGLPVRRYRLTFTRSEARALLLPGVREALAESHEEEIDAGYQQFLAANPTSSTLQ